MKSWLKIAISIAIVLAVIALAWVIRWHALTTLNIDYDEDDYLRAGQEYAQSIRAKDWRRFLDTNYRPEHPPLAKILVGFSIAKLPETPLIADRPSSASPNNYLPRNQLKNGRVANAIFGTLTVGLLALVNPIAGIMLAIHAFTVKYVSQIMLEALPSFFSLLSVLLYMRYKKSARHQTTWLVLSAVALGFTAASKYLYCVAGIAVLLDWIFEVSRKEKGKKEVLRIVLWCGIALLAFFAADPYLWHDPINRLKESVLFHSAYSSGAIEVEEAGYPVWQPLYWLFTTPKLWQPEAIWIALDPFISILALFGIGRQWRKRPVMVIWLLVAIVFLFIWPTKWPQYIVILTAPLCLTASEGLLFLIIDPLRNFFAERKSAQVIKQQQRKGGWKRAAAWLLPGLLLFTVFTLLPLLYQLGVSLTDFSSTSIRDGLNGGVWREIWQGLTGKADPSLSDFQTRAREVHFVGFGIFGPAFNYLLSSGTFFNNLFWVFTSVAIQTALGMLISLLLWQRGVIFKKGWQALFILPWAIPEMIGALMWFNVFAPTTGWLSLGVQQYGDRFPFAALIGWTQSSDLWLLVLLISGVWYGFPFMMLATSAALKMLPEEVLETAALDGAKGWTIFKYVVWPLLLPLVLPAMIIRAIFAFNQFYLFQAFHSGGVTLASLSYDLFYDGLYSSSAIVNVFNVLFLVLLVIILNRTNRVDEGVAYA